MAIDVKDRLKLVSPFLSATRNVINTMCFLECKIGNPALKPSEGSPGDVIGVIGMTGEHMGASLALVFQKEAILHIVSKMLGEDFAELNDDVVDAVGELTNMISGCARKELSESMGVNFEMAIPSMIKGPCQINYHKTASPVIQVPFDCEGKIFWLEICFTK